MLGGKRSGMCSAVLGLKTESIWSSSEFAAAAARLRALCSLGSKSSYTTCVRHCVRRNVLCTIALPFVRDCTGRVYVCGRVASAHMYARMRNVRAHAHLRVHKFVRMGAHARTRIG